MGATEGLNTVLGVTCEVSLKQIYENQPLFAEVDDFLSGHGFVLIVLNQFTLLFSEKVNRSVRFNGQLYGEEVLYLKKTEFLRDSQSL